MQLCLTSGVSAAALSTLSAPRHRLPPASVAAFAAAPRRLRHSCSTCVKAQAVFEGPTGSGDEPLPEQPLAGSSPILEVERQTERALTYAGLTALLGVSGLVLAAAPATVVQFVWATRPSLFVAGVARITGALVLLAAVCANCLKEAAEHERLPSDTYQRLNLGLMWWGVGTCLALWTAKQQPTRLALGLCTLLLSATSFHAAMTVQETSEGGLNPFFLAKRFLSSLGNLSSYHNTGRSSIVPLYGYGLAAKGALAAALAILLQGRLQLAQAVTAVGVANVPAGATAAQNGLLLVPMGTLGNAVARVTSVGYLLLSLVLFILKDAAQRGRLGASTFKQLNIGVAVVGITASSSVAAGLQAGFIKPGLLASWKLGAMLAVTCLTLFNYFAAK
ncbi:hypothetical protein D9Q98_001449 [Chlorella vulgaris]|uniref:Uncharacterized protein n=1 Tax=Chlorella vulgaris TaxID=3077 RepID=A0A9D4U020_CHLVU|nr:hypothetical protein D9Q98_001449 [Chlorella vulgaris]